MAKDFTNAYRPFPTTHWSLVYRAGNQGSAKGLLEGILNQYLPALKVHLVKGKHLRPDEADDVLQGFVLDKMILDDLLGYADHKRGRFRTFLLRVLDNYLSNQQRHDRARTRSPGTPLESIDDRPIASKTNGDLPTAFDLEWARQLISRALQLMEEECLDLGRHDLWVVFQSRVLQPALGESDTSSYSDMVAQGHFDSPTQAHNALATAKRMYMRALRRAISKYAVTDAEIEEELADLKRILFEHRA